MHVCAPVSGSTCYRTALGRILEGECRLRRVLEGQPEPLDQVDQEDHPEELHECLHGYPRSSTKIGSVRPTMMTRSLRSTVLSLRILSWRRISPYNSASGRGGHPET